MIATKPARRVRHAFSLIEVTLSLAIVAFALLSIMALMPVGLKMMSDSSQGEVMANIITQLRGQFQQLPFTADTDVGDTTTVSSLNNTVYYYDNTGNTNAAAAPTAFYKATFTTAPLTTTAPGTDSSGKTNYFGAGGTSAVGIYTNNAVAITVVLTYPNNAPLAPQKSVTNVIFVAKQVGL